MGDSLLSAATEKVYAKARNIDGVPLKRGIGFPTCITPNNAVGNFSPLSSNPTVLQEGDLVKMCVPFCGPVCVCVCVYAHVRECVSEGISGVCKHAEARVCIQDVGQLCRSCVRALLLLLLVLPFSFFLSLLPLFVSHFCTFYSLSPHISISLLPLLVTCAHFSSLTPPTIAASLRSHSPLALWRHTSTDWWHRWDTPWW
jgi:uncharacterized membrane protein